MRARIQGAVLVAAIVEADGTVRDARVVRSLDGVFGLDQAAVRAANQWVFRPATMDGQASRSGRHHRTCLHAAVDPRRGQVL